MRDAAILDAALDAVITADERGRIVAVNRAGETLLGESRDRLLGKSATEMISALPGGNGDAIPSGSLSIEEFAGALGRRVEATVRRSDGVETPVELAVTRTGSNPIRLTVWIRDLSSAKALQEEARRRAALLEDAEVLAGIGGWELVPEEDQLRWSANLFRIMGYEPDEVEPSVEFFYERVHPDDRERMEGVVDRLERKAVMAPVPYRVIRPDGTVRHLRATMALAAEEDGGRRRLLGAIQDLTESLWASREIEAHIAVSEALASWVSFEAGAEGLLARLGSAIGSELGTLWTPNAGVLVSAANWASRSLDLSEFERASRGLRFPRGGGLPGRAWELGRPLSIAAAALPNRSRRRAAVAAGLRGALAIPAQHKSATVAVLEFYSREEMELTERLARSLRGIGDEIGDFLARQRGSLGARALTARELEILQMAAGGHTGPRIAEQLVISPATVKTHFEHIYEKLGVADRAAAVATALRLGLIE